MILRWLNANRLARWDLDGSISFVLERLWLKLGLPTTATFAGSPAGLIADNQFRPAA